MNHDLNEVAEEVFETYEDEGTIDLTTFGDLCFLNAKSKGFWDNANEELVQLLDTDPGVNVPNDLKKRIRAALVAAGGRNAGEMIALEHSELSERLEAVREKTEDGKPVMSVKVVGFTLEEEEAADSLIRLMDYCRGRGLRVEDAAVAKMAYNFKRPYKHGRNF